MTDSIRQLEHLVEAVEQARVNIAPTYQEYMPVAFAIANECGEAGREYFHRLCILSEKYLREDADKLYNHALKDGSGKNSLGTVWHLAEQAGVELKKLSVAPPASFTHPRACEEQCFRRRLSSSGRNRNGRCSPRREFRTASSATARTRLARFPAAHCRLR